MVIVWYLGPRQKRGIVKLKSTILGRQVLIRVQGIIRKSYGKQRQWWVVDTLVPRHQKIILLFRMWSAIILLREIMWITLVLMS